MSLTLAVAITDLACIHYKIAHDVWTGASILKALTSVKVSHGVFPKDSSETLKLYAYGMVEHIMTSW